MPFVFRFSGLVLSCLLLVVVCHTPAPADGARLSELSVTPSEGVLVFQATVAGAFNEKMEAAIKSGVPVTFTFLIRAARVRRMWFDRDVAEYRVSHTITYDNLKEEFTVHRSWEGEKTLVTKSLDQARNAMVRIEGLPLCSLDDLERDTVYRVSAKAELDKLTLPLYLHYVLFFVSFWDVETDWHHVDFTY